MTAKTASERAKELNAETQAWIGEDPENRGAGFLIEEDEFWAERGIRTADELDHDLLAAEYWDSYKEVHGIRPRWMDPWSMSTEDLREALDDLCEYMEAYPYPDDGETDWPEGEEPEPPETKEQAQAREERENSEGYEPDTKPLTHNPFANLTL